jgi:amidase
MGGRVIAVLRSAFGETNDPLAASVNDLIEKAIDVMKAAGASIVDIAIPDLEYYAEFTSLYMTHSRHDIDAFLGARPEMPMKKLKDIVESGKFHPAIELLPELAQGPEVPTAQADYYERYTARETFQRIIINQMAKVGASAVVFPTTNIPSPTRVDLDAGKWGTFTFPTNTLIAAQSWMPAISVPAGFTTQGLPVGMEILGLPYREADLLSLAYAFEQATNHRRPSAILPELV